MKPTNKGQARKEEILQTAEQVFIEKGFLASSIGDIIRALGISSGAVYHHFPTKRAILEGLAERGARKLQEDMLEWLNDDSLTPSEKVERFLAKAESLRQTRLAVDRLQLGLAREDPEMHELVVQLALNKLTDHLSGFIEQGIETGDFNVPYPRAAAVTIILLLAEFMHRAGRVEKLASREEINAMLRITITSLLGVKKQAKGKTKGAKCRGRSKRAKGTE